MDMYLIFAIFCSVFALVATFYCLKFALILIKIEDELEIAIEELDKSYVVLEQILQKPVFFDSVEVRQCINEIKNAQRLVMIISNKLQNIESEKLNIEKGIDERKEKDNESDTTRT